MAEGLEIRAAQPGDESVILSLIRELAEYENLLHEVVATETDLAGSLFGESPPAEALVGEMEGGIVAFALFFHTFSTFEGRHGLYLEDLYVQPMYRGRGIGTAFLRRLAGLALERGCARFEWAALDWNEPAIRVYQGIGARAMDEWTTFRLDGSALRDFAER